jgi:hypothetical protein
LQNHSAVDHQDLTGHVIGCRRRQEPDRANDVTGLGDTTEQDRSGKILHGLAGRRTDTHRHEILVELLPQGGGNHSWSEGIDSDSLAGKCSRASVSERDNSEFAGTIGSKFGVAGTACNRGCIDDLASVDSIWISPRMALEEGKRGRFTLVFATERNLWKLARFSDCASAIAAAQADPIVIVMPERIAAGHGHTLKIPAAAG